MPNLRGISSILGFLLHFTMGTTLFTLANMNTYVIAFIRKHVDANATYTTGVWQSVIFMTGTGIAMGFGSWLQPKIGSSWVCLVGSVVFSGATEITYFSAKWSFAAFIVTYCFLPGIGTGIAYTVPLINNAKVGTRFG